MLLTAVSVLAACSASTPSARAPITLPEIPVELQTCDEGVLLPEKHLSQLETETYWLKDRKTLKNCRNTHRATIDFYEDLKTRLSTPE